MQNTQVAIDKFGRILIPKEVRDHLGMNPGVVMQLIEKENEIVIKLPDHNKALLTRDAGVLVYTGEAAGDLENALSDARESRFKDLY